MGLSEHDDRWRGGGTQNRDVVISWWHGRKMEWERGRRKDVKMDGDHLDSQRR